MSASVYFVIPLWWLAVLGAVIIVLVIAANLKRK
jgi:hypothetical protein